MAASRFDWSVMRGALVLFVVAALVGGGLVGAAEWFNARVAARYAQQKKVLDSVQSSYQQVDEEESIMREYLPVYRDYVEAGIIGPERRLTWVEALRGAAGELDMPSLRYEIGEQQRHDPEVPLRAGRHRIFRTDMTIDMGLFHEGDLPRVLQALENDAIGLYTVEACEVRREQELFNLDPRRANLAAACRLHWFTLQAPDG